METVPKTEIQQRIRRFQADLAKMGLQGAFILQNADIFYFTGTIQSSVLFVPSQGEPILMVQKNLQRARQESSLKEIVPINNRNQIPQVLGDFRFGPLTRAGLEMDVLPANLYLGFKKAIPRCRWVDVSDSIRKLRMIKSGYEIKQIKKATAILHIGFEEINKLIQPGMTELEIDGYLAMIARREGHMGTMRMRGWNQEMTYAHVLSGDNGSVVSMLKSPHGGSGNTPAMAQGAGFRKIKKNEPIGIDFGVAVNGYIGDMFRTYVIGNLPDPLKKAYGCAQEILALLSENIRPGISCAQLYEAALEKAANEGLREYFMGHGEGQVKFIGHGIGLEIDDYPIISPHFNGVLEKGMVLALEPKFVFPKRGVVGLEDDYLVTSNGSKRLTQTDQSLIQI